MKKNKAYMLPLAMAAHEILEEAQKTEDYKMTYQTSIAVTLDCISHSLAVIADTLIANRIQNGPMEEHHETPDDIADFLGEILGWKEDEDDD